MKQYVIVNEVNVSFFCSNIASLNSCTNSVRIFACINIFSGSLNVMGVCFGVGASCFVALYSIYTKKVLPAVDNNVWRLAMYNNFNAIFLFLPLIVIFGEVGEVFYFPKLLSVQFWIIMSLSGVFGFAIGYVTGLQIQVTSPLTHNISGTAKAAAQTVLATVYFHEIKSSLWWASNFVVLFGSAAYTQVKRLEMKQKHEEDAKEQAKEQAAADEANRKESSAKEKPPLV